MFTPYFSNLTREVAQSETAQGKAILSLAESIYTGTPNTNFDRFVIEDAGIRSRYIQETIKTARGVEVSTAFITEALFQEYFFNQDIDQDEFESYNDEEFDEVEEDSIPIPSFFCGVNEDSVEESLLDMFEIAGGISTNIGENVFGDPLALALKYRGNKRILEILKWCGSFAAAYKTKKKHKITEAKHFPVGVEYGSEISDIIPSEFANMAVEELEYLFFKDLIESSLMVYEYKAKEETDNGDVCVVLDISGSMEYYNFLAPAMGMVLAMLAATLEQNRRFKAILFDGRASSHSFESIEQALHCFAGTACGGGTNFDPVAQIIIGDKAIEDVIIITDGLWSQPNHFRYALREEIKARNINFMGIAFKSKVDPWMEEICGENSVKVQEIEQAKESLSTFAAKSIAR